MVETNRGLRGAGATDVAAGGRVFSLKPGAATTRSTVVSAATPFRAAMAVTP